MNTNLPDNFELFYSIGTDGIRVRNGKFMMVTKVGDTNEEIEIEMDKRCATHIITSLNVELYALEERDTKLRLAKGELERMFQAQ